MQMPESRFPVSPDRPPTQRGMADYGSGTLGVRDYKQLDFPTMKGYHNLQLT